MISIKTKDEIKIIREGGKILAKIMKAVAKMAKPGITTKELDRAAEALILKYGAKPSFKNYQGFPYALCTSVNEEIVHCFPSERELKEGDVLCLDLGIFFKGFHTDMAITIGIGKTSLQVKRLIRVTKKALKVGIKKAKSGNTFGDIGFAVQKYVETQGFNVVRDLCGHGIGRKIHEEPQIPNYGKRKTGPEIKEGMVFALEPMVTMGDWKLKKAKDGYGYQTADTSLTAHFEHTIAINKRGLKILTK